MMNGYEQWDLINTVTINGVIINGVTILQGRVKFRDFRHQLLLPFDWRKCKAAVWLVNDLG